MVTDRLAAGIGDDCDRCAAQLPNQFNACRARCRSYQPTLCEDGKGLRPRMQRRSDVHLRALAVIRAAPAGATMHDVKMQIGVLDSAVIHALAELVATGAIRIAGKRKCAQLYMATT